MATLSKSNQAYLSGRNIDQINDAINRTQTFLKNSQYAEGYWWGELECNNTMESEYIFLVHFLGVADSIKLRKVAHRILSKQLADGSWGQYFGSPGDLSTSIECYFALKLSGYNPESSELMKAKEFILDNGGIPKARVFTKIWLALLNQWKWADIPQLIPEMVFISQGLPFNIYKFSSWARPTIVPLLILFGRRPVAVIPDYANLDEIQNGYSPNGSKSYRSRQNKFVMLASKLMGLYEIQPFHPFRKLAEKRLLNWVLTHQENDGLWAGIQPSTFYSLLALYSLGFDVGDPVMQKGLSGVDRLCWESNEDMAVQGCISPGWDTALGLLALLESGIDVETEVIDKSIIWLLSNQVTINGDWIMNAGNVSPGGWAFEFHNNNYPDIDDTALVIMGLTKAYSYGIELSEIMDSIHRGLGWVLGLQSRSGGWAAFDKDNCSKYLSDLTFSDFGEVIDPPTVDVTGHVLEMLGNLGCSMEDLHVNRACRFVQDNQEPDGSWFGRWGVNYIYGTACVLPGLAAVGEDMGAPYIVRAAEWLVDHQNEDGGWGETCGSYADPSLRGVGPSTASQTSWALIGLIASCHKADDSIYRGIQYLMDTQQQDGTWDEPYFTGTGFPGYGTGCAPYGIQEDELWCEYDLSIPSGLMIRYDLYRIVWPLLALARYKQSCTQ